MVPTGRHAQPRPMKPLSAPTRVSAACGFCHTATGQVKVAMVTDHAAVPKKAPPSHSAESTTPPRPAIAPAGGLILEGGAPYTSETLHQARPGLAGRPAHGQDAGPVQVFLRKFPSTRWSSWKTNSPIKKRPITSSSWTTTQRSARCWPNTSAKTASVSPWPATPPKCARSSTKPTPEVKKGEQRRHVDRGHFRALQQGAHGLVHHPTQIGRASCRERV